MGHAPTFKQDPSKTKFNKRWDVTITALYFHIFKTSDELSINGITKPSVVMQIQSDDRRQSGDSKIFMMLRLFNFMSVHRFVV
jgi:hypothetical protein